MPLVRPVTVHGELAQVPVMLPGLLVALWVLTLREPARTGVMAGDHPSFAEFGQFMTARGRAFGFLILGFALSGVMWNGAIAWIPTYFIRVFGWTASQVSLPYGLITIVSGMSGIILGGSIATRLRGQSIMDANIRVGLLAIAIAMPAGIAATFAGSANIAMALFAVFLFGCSMPWGSAVAALHEITPNQMRGQVSAVYLFCLSLLGMGLGPTMVASFTDHLFHNDMTGQVDRPGDCHRRSDLGRAADAGPAPLSRGARRGRLLINPCRDRPKDPRHRQSRPATFRSR